MCFRPLITDARWGGIYLWLIKPLPPSSTLVLAQVRAVSDPLVQLLMLTGGKLAFPQSVRNQMEVRILENDSEKDWRHDTIGESHIFNLLQIGLGCTLAGICVALVIAACTAWKLCGSRMCQCRADRPSSHASTGHRHAHDVQVTPVSAPGTHAKCQSQPPHDAQP